MQPPASPVAPTPHCGATSKKRLISYSDLKSSGGSSQLFGTCSGYSPSVMYAILSSQRAVRFFGLSCKISAYSLMAAREPCLMVCTPKPLIGNKQESGPCRQIQLSCSPV